MAKRKKKEEEQKPPPDPLLSLGHGLHFDIPFTAYLGSMATSHSDLGLLAAAPALLHAERKRRAEEQAKRAAEEKVPEEVDTPASLAGKAIHTALLEPDEFPERYVTAEQCTGTKGDESRCTNPGTRLTKEFGWRCGVHSKAMKPEELDEGKRVLPKETHEMCVGLRDNALSKGATYANPDVRRLLLLPGQAEATGVWQDEETGEWGRLRGDRLVEAGATCLDIKTVERGVAAPGNYAKKCFNDHHYRQQGWYQDGLHQIDWPSRNHTIIVAERARPFLIAAYRIIPNWLDAGRAEARHLLRLAGECSRRGQWPGYAARIVNLAPPGRWAWNRMQENLRVGISWPTE